MTDERKMFLVGIQALMMANEGNTVDLANIERLELRKILDAIEDESQATLTFEAHFDFESVV